MISDQQKHRVPNALLVLNIIDAAQDTYRRFSVMIVAFSVAPSGTGHADGSVSDAVAAAVKTVRDSGLPHRTSSMFTELEVPG